MKPITERVIKNVYTETEITKNIAANFHPSGCIKGLLVFNLLILVTLNLVEHFMLLRQLLKI